LPEDQDTYKSNGLDKRQSAKLRRFWVVAFLLVFIAAAIPRLVELKRSLWAAEAWVANSILADSLNQVFYYDAWLQTTPPLFLLLARAVVKALGVSNLTLRLVPFTFGMAATILIAALAMRLFRRPFAMLCMMLIAFSPTAIRYSLELKQYTGDLAMSAAILLALWSCIERNRGAFFWIIALFTVGVFLSQTSVMFIPLAACILLFAERTRPLKARILMCTGFLLFVGLLADLQYLIFVKPNLAPHLESYWNDGFLQNFRPVEVALFYMKYVGGSFIGFFLPNQIKDVLSSLPALAQLTMFAVALAVVAGFVIAIRRDTRRLWILSFWLVPALTLIFMNVLRLYPISARRILLFLLPCVSLVIVLMLETLWHLTSIRLPCRVTRALSKLSVFFGVLCVLLAFILGTRPILWHISDTEDVEGAVKYLKSKVEKGDAIYVHGSTVESVKLYLRTLEWQEAPIVYGKTGWPCCIRKEEMQLGNADDDTVRGDVERASEQAPKGSLWLVYGWLAGHELKVQLDYLRARACFVQQHGSFTHFTLYKVTFSPGISRITR